MHHEKPDFNNFQGILKIKSLEEEGRTKETAPEEISVKNETEKLMIGLVVKGEYKKDPYISEDKIFRMRIRDKKGAIVYDNTLKKYVALNKKLGVPVYMEDIERYHAQARQSGV